MAAALLRRPPELSHDLDHLGPLLLAMLDDSVADGLPLLQRPRPLVCTVADSAGGVLPSGPARRLHAVDALLGRRHARRVGRGGEVEMMRCTVDTLTDLLF